MKARITITTFLGILIAALPFLLAGVLIGSAIEIFVSESVLNRIFPKNKVLATACGASLGTIFPTCECGMVPVARSLIRSGVPSYAAIAFMLAAPIVNPLVFISTWIAFENVYIALTRLLSGFLLAFIGTLVFMAVKPETALSIEQSFLSAAVQHTENATSRLSKIRGFIDTSAGEFLALGKFLVIGSVLAAVVLNFVSRDMILTIGRDPGSSILAMMSLASGLSLCSSSDAFVARAFSNSFTPGSVLAFMLTGPLVATKSFMLLSVLKLKPTLYILAAILISIFTISSAINFRII